MLQEMQRSYFCTEFTGFCLCVSTLRCLRSVEGSFLHCIYTECSIGFFFLNHESICKILLRVVMHPNLKDLFNNGTLSYAGF